MICRETGITQVEANLITVVTQIGYALGLLFVVPLADMVSVRRIVVVGMSVASVSAVTIGLAGNVWVLWGASLMLGVCIVGGFFASATLLLSAYEQLFMKQQNEKE